MRPASTLTWPPHELTCPELPRLVTRHEGLAPERAPMLRQVR